MNSRRKRIYQLFEIPQEANRPSKYVDYALLLLMASSFAEEVNRRRQKLSDNIQVALDTEALKPFDCIGQKESAGAFKFLPALWANVMTFKRSKLAAESGHYA
jgi:hypothetical protein